MSPMLNRRKFLTASAGAVSAFRFAPAIARAAPFKVGLLTVKTGTLAQVGIQMETGHCPVLEGEGQRAGGPPD